ncbi:L,D-transpeptidase family protein [Geomonas sp. Red32]|uniref:L,D-transpeptidase family protein n=1 Tax=Geomonas sp. Red32 TaxID=2912856 RepID=UPI00202CE2BD|nr:L,D-transpeptidase family protein [Geomonas sp. Red32]MCM0080693.1 L,D-transpeptidase family protein [Geomonas sp. Red32]
MSDALKYGMSGEAVTDLQRRLNCSGPSRLPALDADGNFGVTTLGRVMEFQYLRHLQADGVCGPLTFGPLKPACDAPLQPAGRCILVDLINGVLYAFEDGNQFMKSAPIHGGAPEDPSAMGVFPMSSRRLRHHTSSKFPTPPDNMEFAMFYNGAQAIHRGNPGKPSHGCIHVGYPDIEKLFDWAGSNDILVIVAKQ